jgi:hypothetical protein
MFGNYCKIAWRSLIRNKSFSIINISGLALGITSSLLILLWVRDERSVDRFHANGARLYQVYERDYFDGKVDASYATQGLLAEELKRVVPEVQYSAEMDYAAAPGTMNTFEVGDKIEKKAGFFAGADFFKMFTYRLLQGNTENALRAPHAIAISRRMAEHFFGSPEKAMGGTLRFDNTEALQVSAVFEDVPSNSSQQFDFLRTWADYVQQNDWISNWGNTSPSTFVLLRPGANPAVVEGSIKDFIYRYRARNEGARTELGLQRYSDKYLHSSFTDGKVSGGRIEYVALFTLVAIFILLIACINFMNLATAQSARRAKEVGLRKVVGAARSSLIRQFIGEAMLLTGLAVLASLMLSSFALPMFNELTGKQLSLPLGDPLFWVALVVLTLVTGVIAGSYPALYLSSLNPVRVLKGRLTFSWGSTFVRKGLVCFQFILSIILIVGTLVIHRQMDYIRTKDIGYDRGNLVYIPIEGDLIGKYELFKQEADKIAGVVDVSKMRNSPTIIQHHTGSISWPGKDPNLSVPFADAVVGYDFAKTLKLQLDEGRDFSKAFGTDSTGFLLNEAAVKKMGLRNPIGQSLSWGDRTGKVIGVLKDFHFNSLHQNIEPLIVRLDEQWKWGMILVRTEAGKTESALSGLAKLCKALNPAFPFTYQFSDDEYTRLYKSEAVAGKLSDAFAMLAVFISCLGLFGLATFTAAQRIKEIGVRKVLGASTFSIATLLSGTFLRIVVVSMLIAFPLAGLLMHQWLRQFAYKVDMGWWVFVLAAAATLVISLATVSYQSIHAALTNPIKSLRNE